MRPTASTLVRILVVGLAAALMPFVLAPPASAAKVKTIRINDASVVEGDSGSKNLTFTVSWSGSKGGGVVSVHYATANVTATAGSDYTAKSGTVSLSNGGCRCGTVTVPVLGDVLFEGTETFQVNLSNPVNATISDARGIGTIYDNEGPPSLVVSDASAAEASGSLSFSVVMTSASVSTVTVDYASTDGTALAGSDYTTVSGTLTFTSGQTSKTVAVPVTDDVLSEDDETVTLNLSNATNAPIVDPQGVGTILDDDPEPDVSIAGVTLVEGDTGTTTASFPVTLSAPSGREVDVDYSTADGTATAGSDYVAASGTLVFAAGETLHSIDVAVRGDFLNEADETFAVTLSGPVNASIVTGTGTGTIQNDDSGPMLSVADATIAEGNSGTASLVFQVSLAPASAGVVTVDYATTDGTATSGTDYDAAAGTLSFAAGETTKTVVVNVHGYTSVEPDETLTLTLSNASGAKIPVGQAVGTITNDDKAPTALTFKVVKGKKTVGAKGLLEPAATGMKVTVTLLKKRGAKYVKIARKSALVKKLTDRDGDGWVEGAYLVSFARPGRGAYMCRASFAGNAQYGPSTKRVKFKL